EKYGHGSDLIERLKSELVAFTGREREQEDDVTLVTLARDVAAPEHANGPERLLGEFEVASQPGNERLAIEKVADVLKPLDLPALRLEEVKTAVAEATMSAMEHGNKYQAELPVGIRVAASAEQLVISVTDSAGEQAIPEAPQPDLDAKLAGLQSPRGWGLFLIRN